MTMIRDDKELETLAQEVSSLINKTQLTHNEEKKIEDELLLLCKKTYEYIFPDDYSQDYFLFIDAFKEIIKGYESDKTRPIAERIQNRYKLKCREKTAVQLEEKDYTDAQRRKIAIRNALRKIAQDNGMDSKRVTDEFRKFNLLSAKKVHEFLITNFDFSPEELNDFDKKIFNKHYTINFSLPSESSAQNTAISETSEYDDYPVEEISFFEQVLDITHEEYAKQNNRQINNMRGYWSIRFIEGYLSEETARDKEQHIILRFYLDNIDLYNVYEDRVFENYRYSDDNLTDSELKKIHRSLHNKAVKELHRDLMPKMSVELKLQPDTWRKTYKNINSYVWCVINDLHIFRE